MLCAAQVPGQTQMMLDLRHHQEGDIQMIGGPASSGILAAYNWFIMTVLVVANVGINYCSMENVSHIIRNLIHHCSYIAFHCLP